MPFLIFASHRSLGQPQNTVIDLAAEGVSSANTGTQNKDIIFALRDDLEADDPNAHYEFHWPEGTIQVSDPRGFMGLFWQKHVAHANGTGLQSTHATWEFPFVLGDILTTNSRTMANPFNYTSIVGDLIETVTAGATSITCQTVADAADYTTGMRVLLHGYDQQLGIGYPPNARYYEWKVVASPGGNGTTGVVPFTAALTRSYDEEWFEISPHGGLVGQTFGKPRILSLDRGSTGFYPVYVEFLGTPSGRFTFKNKVATPGSGGVLIVGDTVVMDGVTIEGPCWPSTNRVFELRNSDSDDIEPDKICGSGVFEDVDVTDYIGAGTSFDSLSFSRITTGARAYCCAKENSFTDITVGTDFGGAFTPTPGIMTIDSLVLPAANSITEPEMQTVTIADVDGNDLVFPDDGNLTVFVRAREGTWIFKSDGTKYGQVGRIGIDDGAGNFRIEWEPGTYVGSAPVASEVWRYEFQRVIDLGGHTGPAPRWHVNAARFAGRGEPVSGAWETVWTEADVSFTANRTVPFYGQIDKITVNVTTAYTGDDAAHEIWLTPNGTALRINCKITGTRVIDRVGATVTGAQSGDVLAHTSIPAWTTTLLSQMRNGVSGFPTDLTPAAAFTITIRWKDVSLL